MNYEEILDMCAQINECHQKISNSFPYEKQEILKHIAASSIHLTLFLHDFCPEIKNIKPKRLNPIINEFLEKCGCSELLNKCEKDVH